MSITSPIRDLLEASAKQAVTRRPVVSSEERPGAARGQAVGFEDGLETVPYAVPGGRPHEMVELVAAYGPIELEYAALRRGVGLVDCPHLGILRVTGGDRFDFLNRMLTQDLKGLHVTGGGSDGRAAEAFCLNRKGRIEGDMLLAETGDRTLVSLDIHQTASVKQSLSAFVITEEVEIQDVSQSMHTIALHGPGVGDLLKRVASAWDDASLHVSPSAAAIEIAGCQVCAVRRDQVGQIGVLLLVELDAAGAVCEAIIRSGGEAGNGGGTGGLVRPVGWYAWNIARIEAGTPLMNIDFSSDSLPHESGVLDRRVSFRKGCYPGQEIVARMQSLGKPKQQVVGLKVEEDALPIGGAQVFAEGDAMNPVGVVTSSTLSPMLGSVPIALAVVKSAHADAGTMLLVDAEGRQARTIVTTLPFWRA